jgi:hypothetical protein
MWRAARLSFLTLIAGIALGVVDGQLTNAQQQPIKRTDLVCTENSDSDVVVMQSTDESM